MARPKAKLLQKLIKGHKVYEILESDSIWVVLYKEKPINICTYTNPEYIIDDKTVIPVKYQKTVYLNEAHAVRRAKQLEYMYNLEDISVKRIDFNKDV
jgi:hypothetical protein